MHSEVFRAIEFDGVGYKVSGDTTLVDVQSHLQDIPYMFLRPTCSIREAFLLHKMKNFWSWDNLLKYQIIRISEL
jgi:hypothetical protein